jgi:Spermine/spermidine synthase domain
VPEGPPARALVAVGLVAGSVLALQVLLTRLLSAILFYHFGFLAISLALLGAGSGAIAVYLKPTWFARPSSQAVLSRWSAAVAVLMVVVPFVLVRLDYNFNGALTTHFAITLAIACLLAALPFTAAGVVIALAIRDWTASAGRVYASDLAGAGIGALMVVPAMRLLDPATLMAGLGLVTGIAAVLFAPPGSVERRVGAAAAAAAGLIAVAAAATSLYYLEPFTHLKPVYERWTPLSRVIGYPPEGGSPNGLLFYDRVYAPVPLRPRGTPLPTARKLSLRPQAIGHQITAPGRVLVIGGGGGRDIYNALEAGKRRVDVIELNQGIVDMVDKDMGRWSGSPYNLPRVHTSVGDGRSVLARRSTHYDEIHIGFTDTLSANSATAFALTEANLYTVEAFDEYLDHLRPNGVLSVSRLYRLVGDEALRTTVLALDALKRRGVRHPERNVVMLMSHDILHELFGTVLVRPRAWTAAELRDVRRRAAAEGVSVGYAPGGPYYREWAQLARAPSVQAFCSGYRLNVCAPTDDKPFFFNMKRLSDLGSSPPPGYIYSIDPFRILMLTLGILLGLAVLAFVLPLVLARRRRRPPIASLGLFAAIGLGFLLLEVALIQRFVLFLGFPTYALSVVLFALLLFTGVGALLTTRAADARRTLVLALAVVTGLITVGAFALQPLLRGLIELPFAARVALTVVILAPYGVTMGMAMPIGLKRLEALHPGAVPWAWGINGIMSVLASVLAVAIAITAGFTVTTLVAALCYLAALLHALLGRWPSERPAPTEGPTRTAAPAAR